jgi:hypothetical protein
MSLKSIQKAIENFKELIEASIIENGAKGKEAMIRSSRPILNIHEAVKVELVEAGINEDLIFPPLNSRTPELKLAGSRKQKNQDVCVVSNLDKAEEILEEGLLQNVVDEYGEKFTERTISINIRSQISSIQKNFDTLYERTTSEAINLHDRCPKMVLGEVYMIAVPEYDDKEVKDNKIVFKKPNQATVLKYIKSFQAINNRKGTEKNFYKYEKVCAIKLNRWKMNPILRSRNSANLASLRSFTCTSSIQTSPKLGYNTQPNSERSVVLPEPDGPIISKSSPAFNSTVLGLSAVIIVSPALYSLPAFITLATILVAFLEFSDAILDELLFSIAILHYFFCRLYSMFPSIDFCVLDKDNKSVVV